MDNLPGQPQSGQQSGAPRDPRLDLREASFAEHEATISGTVLMGDITVERLAPRGAPGTPMAARADQAVETSSGR